MEKNEVEKMDQNAEQDAGDGSEPFAPGSLPAMLEKMCAINMKFQKARVRKIVLDNMLAGTWQCQIDRAVNQPQATGL